jgi:hypothetical protein
MRYKLTIVIVLLALVAAALAAADDDSLSAPARDIVKMAQAGVDESVLIAYAQKSQTPFGLTAKAIATLKAEGVSQEVLAAMQRRDQELANPVSVARGPVTEDQLFRLRFGFIHYGGKLYPVSDGLNPEIKRTLEADPAVQEELSSYARLRATSRATFWGGLALVLGGSAYGMLASDNDWGNRKVNGGIVVGALGTGLVSLIISGIAGDSAYVDLYNGLAQYNHDLLAQGR